MTEYTTIRFLVDIAQIGAAIFVGLELWFIYQESRREHIRQKKFQTLEIANHQIEVLEETNKWIRENEEIENFFDEPASIAGEDLSKVLGYLNRVERLAVGARHEIYSVEVIADISGSLLRNRFLKLAKFIRYRRQKSRNSKAWVEFEWLSFEIENFSSRKKFPKDWRFGKNGSTPKIEAAKSIVDVDQVVQD